jgi:Pyruvate/2-oxoacid:ferredoxin oxidoreductase gamma subunit
MLGAYTGASDVLPAEAIVQEIESEFAGRKARFIPANVAAFEAGLAEGLRAEKRQ